MSHVQTDNPDIGSAGPVNSACCGETWFSIWQFINLFPQIIFEDNFNL